MAGMGWKLTLAQRRSPDSTLQCPAAILITMTVIQKPEDVSMLFGGKTVVLLGAFDKDGMRRWQGRLRRERAQAAATGANGGLPAGIDDNFNDRHLDESDDRE